MVINTQISIFELTLTILSDYGEVVATLLLVILYFQQKKVLSKQVSLTEALERADLEVTHAEIITESDQTGYTDTVYFDVKNIGRSPASNLRIWPMIFIQDGDGYINLWNETPGVHDYKIGSLEVENSGVSSNIDGPLNSYSVPSRETQEYKSVLKIGTTSVSVSFTQLFKHIQDMDVESEYVEVYLTLLYDDGVGGRGAARLIGGWVNPSKLDTFEDFHNATQLEKAAPTQDHVFETYDEYAASSFSFYKRPIRWLKNFLR